MTKLSLRVPPPTSGGVGVRKGGFVPSSDAVWITSSQGVPEPAPCRGGGAMNATARREEWHDDDLSVWVIESVDYGVQRVVGVFEVVLVCGERRGCPG